MVSDIAAQDCSWSYGEWTEWTNLEKGTRSRELTLDSSEGKCEPATVVEDEVAVCQGSIISLQCAENQFMEINAVDYSTLNQCFYASTDDQDYLANALEDIQNECNNRNHCELQSTHGLWDHFSSLSSTLSEEMPTRSLELEIKLDASYNCLDSYVHYPESGRSSPEKSVIRKALNPI